jgi:Domain of unknown function (DUF1338)
MSPNFFSQTVVDEMWPHYARMNPQAERIHRLLRDRGEVLVNDHIALRTWSLPGLTVDDLAKPFVAAGYVESGRYVFRDKHLTAKHWQHSDPLFPKVFISQLEWRELSPGAQSLILSHANGMQWPKHGWLCNSGRSWSLSSVEYDVLARESEYAAWVSAWGFVANHFTVSAQRLKTFGSLRELNAFLKSNGFALNEAGGEIKGSPAEGLEQSSTIAADAMAQFSDRERKIPCCYYEFAWRHRLPKGEFFHGFLEKSADKIFESTDRRPG